MTRLAFGAKCGRPGRPPVPVVALACSCPNRLGPSKWLNAAMPSPETERPKSCRLLIVKSVSEMNFSIRLFFRHCFVQIQNQAGDARVGREFFDIQLRVARKFSRT